MSPIAIAGPFGVETFVFADDGIVPNSKLPAIVYRKAIAFAEPDEEAAGEELDHDLQQHGWYLSWTDSVYRKVHYHSITHELLVVFCGTAQIELGGRRLGKVVQVQGGDAVLIPAGVGHRRISSSGDFIVFGAYPIGKDYDLCWDWEKLRRNAKKRIRRVPLPADDPLFGASGPVHEHWIR